MRLSPLLKAKIHHARVTYANPDYVGSIEIDAGLMAKCGLQDGELVHVWAVDHKSRIQTYCFAGPPGSIGINGGAAHFFSEGDRIIIAAFDYADEPIDPVVILVDERNRFVREMGAFAVLA